MSKTRPHPAVPKSIRHKQILDVAEENPNASVEAIATEIPTATVDLVEDVLSEYGDAGPDAAESPSVAETAEPVSEDPRPAAVDLSETQRETLHAIAANPEATQRDLADLLDVSAATISVRVNQIEGFDWEKRHEFATSVLGRNDTGSDDPPAYATTAPADVRSLLDDLADVVSTLEDRQDELLGRESSTETLEPELLHKVIHACMRSNSVSEDEELRILESLV